MALFTEWGEKLNQKAPLQEYPRMQLQRDSYTNLNGLWEYQITEQNKEPDPEKWKKIVVPFALGSKLSGADGQLEPGMALWYRKQFAYKPSVLHTWLNFEAVDQYCNVYVNGIEVGSHAGGYTPFGFDISSMIKYQNSLMLRCIDSSDESDYAYGKQKREHGGMWYTPSSGIWQTVWLEDLGEHAVQDIRITPDYDSQKVMFDFAGNFEEAQIIIAANGKAVHTAVCRGMHCEVQLQEIHPWTPEDPFLYDVYVQTDDDVIKSYFGMRKFSAGKDSEGILRFCLNNKPLFFSGLLDQGYTPDGLMTFPADEAMIYELKKIKDMGFNMLRKHVKQECRRWYYHCDRLGILVMQDMPSGGVYDYKWQTVMPTVGFKQDDRNNPKLGRTDERAQKIYYEELEAMLVREGIFIDYFEDIHVYDEKTRLIHDFNMQRRRWTYIQLHSFISNIRYLPSGFINSQHDQIDKLLQWALVPRTIMMGIIAIMSLVMPFIYFSLVIKWWVAAAIALFTFSLATPDYLVDKNWDRDYLRAPLITIGAIINIFRAGKDEAGNRLDAFGQIFHRINIFRFIKRKKK